MTGRTYTIELDEHQAQIVDEMAESHGMTVPALLIDAIGHGLAMIFAGVDLVEDVPEESISGDPPGVLQRRDREDLERHLREKWEPSSPARDDDMPF